MGKTETKLGVNMSKIKSLPLDVKLLRVGLEYVRKRIKNEDVASLFQNPDDGKISAQTYQNLQFLHAKVKENPPEIELKYGKAFQETLYCDVAKKPKSSQIKSSISWKMPARMSKK